jgi:hypothetical protein
MSLNFCDHSDESRTSDGSGISCALTTNKAPEGSNLMHDLSLVDWALLRSGQRKVQR